MKYKAFTIALCATMLATLSTSCSRKGSSSLTEQRSTTYSSNTPTVRDVDTETAAERRARLKAEAEAEAAAKQAAAEAEKSAAQAEAEARAKAEKAAQQARQEAENAAAKAKEEAEIRAAEAKQAAEEAVTVREEKVTIVETQATETDVNARYHIIIGSFKMLGNARQLCQNAIKNDFIPSIMENEEGLYRVSIYSSSTESTARKKIAEIRKLFPEYVGTWLLVEKR